MFTFLYDNLITIGVFSVHSVNEFTFSEITPANRSRLRWSFRGRRMVTYHAPLQTFGVLRRTGAKWHRKTSYCKLFVTKTTHCFKHIPADDVRELWTHDVNRCHRELILEQNFEIFPEKFHLPPNYILGCTSDPVLQLWPLHLIVDRLRMFAEWLYVRLNVFEIGVQSHSLISGTTRHSAALWIPATALAGYRYRLQLGRPTSDRGVAPTHIWDDLDLLL